MIQHSAFWNGSRHFSAPFRRKRLRHGGYIISGHGRGVTHRTSNRITIQHRGTDKGAARLITIPRSTPPYAATLADVSLALDEGFASAAETLSPSRCTRHKSRILGRCADSVPARAHPRLQGAEPYLSKHGLVGRPRHQLANEHALGCKQPAQLSGDTRLPGS